MWTRETLRSLLSERLQDFRLISVCNREPYIHRHTPEGIRSTEPASGVVRALDPVMRVTGGTWIAHGSGTADRETADPKGRLRVPPGAERYLLRRLWLSKEEEEGYYYGFSNETLWPLCHIAHQRPTFEETHWKQYAAVNARFADAVVEEAGDDRVLVFIQDYHFALLSKLVKERMPKAIVCQFWHIPWPNPEAFRICPWKSELLEGLLGNDLLAFHIQHHCNNFLETVDREIECRIDRENFGVAIRGNHTLIRPHPISVDFEAMDEQARLPMTERRMAELRRRWRLEGLRVALGVDRMDYTKGIPERLRAVDRFLHRHPEFVGRFVLVQVGVPSRTHIRAYQRLQDEVESLVEQVNWNHRTATWEPIVFVPEYQDRCELVAYYRLADVCLVTSLHDGMNLVAKEFVASRCDRAGVLILSRFTGAAREFAQAILVNPYAVDATADALHAALVMPVEEQASRMDRLREAVREQNVYKWVGKLLLQAARLEPTWVENPTRS